MLKWLINISRNLYKLISDIFLGAEHRAASVFFSLFLEFFHGFSIISGCNYTLDVLC